MLEGEGWKVVLLLESILGERSRTIARIKRENFHRGVSCLEPLAGAGAATEAGAEAGAQPRGVSWDQNVKERPQSSVETREETDKLREMISIRRGSTQLEQRGREEGAAPERERPPLTRGSSCTTHHVLKTSERPPLSRGFSCQASKRRTFPSITLTRPHSDILSAVSEIHENLKENRSQVTLTGEETEDEFHEELQGGPRPSSH